MKKKDVELHHVYWVKVSGSLAPVRLDAESPYGGWVGTSLLTRRQVRVKTAARLRRSLFDAELARYGASPVVFDDPPKESHAELLPELVPFRSTIVRADGRVVSVVVPQS